MPPAQPAEAPPRRGKTLPSAFGGVRLAPSTASGGEVVAARHGACGQAHATADQKIPAASPLASAAPIPAHWATSSEPITLGARIASAVVARVHTNQRLGDRAQPPAGGDAAELPRRVLAIAAGADQCRTGFRDRRQAPACGAAKGRDQPACPARCARAWPGRHRAPAACLRSAHGLVRRRRRAAVRGKGHPEQPRRQSWDMGGLAPSSASSPRNVSSSSTTRSSGQAETPAPCRLPSPSLIAYLSEEVVATALPAFPRTGVRKGVRRRGARLVAADPRDGDGACGS